MTLLENTANGKASSVLAGRVLEKRGENVAFRIVAECPKQVLKMAQEELQSRKIQWRQCTKFDEKVLQMESGCTSV